MQSKKTILCVLTLLLMLTAPGFSHGTADQEFSGPFGHDVGINAGSVSQGFTPTADSVGAVDLFLVAEGDEPGLTLIVSIRLGSFDGPILGTSTVAVPAGVVGTVANPYVLHVDFGAPVPLVPGGSYYVRVEGDGGFYGLAASFGDPYPGGQGYQGDFNCCGLDIGFRTYAVAPVAQGPETKDDCKNGGWATFTSPRAFANQGDCIQYVNTGK